MYHIQHGRTKEQVVVNKEIEKIPYSFSKEEVEKCKQKDLLEEMLREMTGEFPGLSQVFVKERDLFLAEFLHKTATMLPNPEAENGKFFSIDCNSFL